MSDSTPDNRCRRVPAETRLSSSLLSRRLIVLIVLCQLHCSLAGHYHDNLDAATSTFNCSEHWCGEEWQPNRILRYKYDVKDELVLEKSVEIKYIYDCTGGSASSEDCELIVQKTNRTTPTRKVTVTRTLENIMKMSPLSLHIISTDNINKTTSSIINSTYPYNQDKIWQFLVPRGCRMVAYFTMFDIEVSDRCANDNFTVQIEKDQPNIHRYCNSLHKVEIRKRRVQMKFHSNSAIARRGFRAHVCLTSDNKHTDNELPCNCGSKGGRSKRAPSTESSQSRSSQSKSKSYRRIKEEKDIKTGELLRWLEGKSQKEINTIVEDTDDEAVRHLARLYQTSLTETSASMS